MITYPQALAEIEQIVAERPDYVYTNPNSNRSLASQVCRYVHDLPDGTAEPGCLLGVWLHRFHGVTLNQLRTQEGTSIRAALHHPAITASIEVSPLAWAFLTELQIEQDKGLRWSEALRLTKMRMRAYFNQDSEYTP